VPDGGAQARLLDHRLHLQHGPIDLIIEAWGEPLEVQRAYAQATARFSDILETLVSELPLLRAPVGEQPRGPVARRMHAAVWPYRDVFITPMAAVAGAVADEVLAAMIAGRALARAYVNDGGDIALHLASGETLRLGVVGDIDNPAIDATATIDHEIPVRGIATSGRSGRSFSLGIADAVTIFAADGAAADAAATIVANAVNADHPAIVRAPANSIDPDSDLRERLVTTRVGTLDEATVSSALDSGVAEAERLMRAGLIVAAMLVLQGRIRTVGRPSWTTRALRYKPPKPAISAPS
jgi:hypothetical protein